MLLHPDDGLGKESWTLHGDADKMREEYSDFEPRLVDCLQIDGQGLKLEKNAEFAGF